MSKTNKGLFLIAMIASLYLSLLAYEPIPPQCSNVNYDPVLSKISYRYTSWGNSATQMFTGPYDQGDHSIIDIALSPEIYTSSYFSSYTYVAGQDTWIPVFLSEQTVDFYLDIPTSDDVDYDLYLYKVADNGNATLVASSNEYESVSEHINYSVTAESAGKYYIRVYCYENSGTYLVSAWLDTGFFNTYDDYNYQLRTYPGNNPSNYTTVPIPATFAPLQEYSYTNTTQGKVVELLCENLTSGGYHYAYADVEYDLNFNYNIYSSNTTYNFGPTIGAIPCQTYSYDWHWQDGYYLSTYGDNELGLDYNCTTFVPDSSTWFYNCHAYAWTLCDLYWISSPDAIIYNLISSGQIIQMQDIYENSHYAQYVVFKKTSNGNYTHSGKILNQAQTFDTAIIRSKCGAYAIYDLLGSNVTAEWIADYGTYKYYFRSVNSSADDQVVANTVSLNGNCPNPFSSSTTIKYSLPETNQNYEIEIFNIKGQKIRTVELDKKTGESGFLWDGSTQKGVKSASGVYFYRLVSNNKVIDTKKMIFIK